VCVLSVCVLIVCVCMCFSECVCACARVCVSVSACVRVRACVFLYYTLSIARINCMPILQKQIYECSPTERKLDLLSAL